MAKTIAAVSRLDVEVQVVGMGVIRSGAKDGRERQAGAAAHRRLERFQQVAAVLARGDGQVGAVVEAEGRNVDGVADRVFRQARGAGAAHNRPAEIGRPKRHCGHARGAGQARGRGLDEVAGPVGQRTRGVAAHVCAAFQREARQDLGHADGARDPAVAVGRVGDPGRIFKGRAEDRQFQLAGG